MAHFIIWIDSNNARIFDLTEDGIVKAHVKRNEANHHTSNKKDHHGDPSVEHFYRDVVVNLVNADELLIIGPGLAKNHFKAYLETHRTELAKKIAGLEETDHPTDKQILALSRKFFKTYNLYNNPIRSGS
jgi:stalled ribosome rescue protein Dom34